MKIKKQDEQHMVIGPILRQRLNMLALLAPIIGCGFVGFQGGGFTTIVGAVFSTISVVFGLSYLGNPQDRKVTIDKLTANISVEERRFLLILRRRIIAFSDVTSVNLDKKDIWFFNIFAVVENSHDLPWHKGQLRHLKNDAWQVSLNVDGKKVRIDHTPNKEDMWSIASGISRFMGKELVDNWAKPKSRYKKELVDNSAKPKSRYKKEDIDRDIDQAVDRGRFRAG